MAARTAVVATSLPGYANVARADQDALLVPPGDAGALAVALRRALYEPERNAALVSSGSQRVTTFSMAQLAERYEGLYEQVLRRR